MTEYKEGGWIKAARGIPAMVEYVSDDGQSNGVAYAGVVSDPGLDADAASMDWSCEPDSDTDPIELVISPESYALLVAKARAYDALVASINDNVPQRIVLGLRDVPDSPTEMCVQWERKCVEPTCTWCH